MKRFHVHAHVESLPESIAFYSKMFGAEPTRVEGDYAKWMLEKRLHAARRALPRAGRWVSPSMRLLPAAGWASHD